MKNKTLLYDAATEEVKKLKLDKYHTRFLVEMVVRKLRHPEEKMDKIATRAMKEMSKNYGKKDLVVVSSSKCLDQLEIALDNSEAVPTEWLSGQTVSHVVKKIAGIVLETVDGESIQ